MRFIASHAFFKERQQVVAGRRVHLDILARYETLGLRVASSRGTLGSILLFGALIAQAIKAITRLQPRTIQWHIMGDDDALN